ncbi:methyltransferase domain-containing protein [Polyangium sp. 15x6]|uniref:class I SAM-dependent methyltransferase n=1 Tax=Polyangium sp. 15x6 TaxID=3042687 RepID=UPI00249AC9D7|nr:methyltransferase domain-containing protein [Polyangium sp. 15x6]MDI3284211.1 methyltransferase domain-containing protein [Polyangium sp. 15x6]
MLADSGGEFDWSGYFSRMRAEDYLGRLDPLAVLLHLRAELGESRPQFTFVVTRMLRSLLRGIDFRGQRVLELGAGTGFLTRWLVSEYGMEGRLVDNNTEARRAFDAMDDHTKDRIDYVMSDLFTYASAERHDVVCSFGVIEHFADKTDILRAHTKHLREGGMLLLLVPMDTPLSRVYYEVYPELNLGYRELWTVAEFKEILVGQGLEVVRVETSRGYSYDMMGAVCRRAKEEK